ncbi:hypothetical protein FVE85_6384 [Porphyridium purpureum]|uniref:Uncharacterized protein n=1 Tax=Porphyridium purpureum TaxID=35688 RepID=A0A5J4Z486_PORPP|nr:hypothetical protein FVE85_6384 [Porphyridium purpureum]|eukprot:POR6878..scf295_1
MVFTGIGATTAFAPTGWPASVRNKNGAASERGVLQHGVIVRQSEASRSLGRKLRGAIANWRGAVMRHMNGAPGEESSTSAASRRSFLGQIMTFAMILVASKPKRGTKEEKTYQLCLSECIYKCTVPRAGPARERSECIRECKDECATTAEQL